MIRITNRTRAAIAASLALAAGGLLLPIGPARAQNDAPKAAPPATSPALDPDAVLGDLSVTRTLNKRSLPAHPGVWQQLIDQPYFKDNPELKAYALLKYGQDDDCEILCNDLLKKKDLPDATRQKLIATRLEAILNEGGDTNIKSFERQVDALPDAQKNSPHFISLRAQAMLAQYRQPDAFTFLKTFVGAHPVALDADTLAAYNMYGHLLEMKAQYADAIDLYAKIQDLASKDVPEDAALRTQIAIACLRLGILGDTKLDGSSKRARTSATADFNAVLAIDGTYWPAKLELARLLFDTHNLKAATTETDEVLNLDPYNVDVRVMMAGALIDSLDFDGAGTVIDEIKAINDSAIVDALQGRILIQQGQLDAAEAPLKRAVARDPYMLEPRGLLAGIYFLRNDKAAAEAQLNAVKTTDRTPHPIALYQAAGILANARQYPDALKLYSQASSEAAWWAQPYIALAQVYLKLGDLKEAQAEYDKGFARDSYDMEMVNQLRLLQLLNNRDTIETAHFIIRYQGDPKPDANTEVNPDIPVDPLAPPPPNDKVLAHLVAIWCEKIYPEVTGDFDFKPAEKTTIELYPAEDEFAMRITGMSQAGTVAASTSNVVAMDVPRVGLKLAGNFDWARVIRHEFTHSVTLGLTENRIPDWLTEAASVYEEQAPRDWEWVRLLQNNYRNGTLLKFNELNAGFAPTKTAIDHELASAESEWVYEYLLATYGHDKMIAFMDCFRDHVSEPEAFKKAFGKPAGEINADFLVWAGQQLKSWGVASDRLPSLDDAKAAAAKNPNDAAAQLVQVEAMVAANQMGDAETAARAIIAKDPKNIAVQEYLALALVGEDKADDAKPILAKLATDAPDRPDVDQLLAQQAMTDKDYDAAAKWYDKLAQARPVDMDACRSLAGIYLIKKDYKNAVVQLEKLAAHEQKDERIPRRAAELLLDLQQFKDAEAYAYRALRIDPYNPINHSLMGRILMAENQPKDAVTYFTYATSLEPSTADFWAGLAEAQSAAGDKAAATAAAKRAVDIDPSSPAKKWIQ